MYSTSRHEPSVDSDHRRAQPTVVPGRLRTQLKKGSTAALILSLLSEGSMYGYQIARELEQRSRGYFTTTEGTLYPVLHQLEERGLLRGEWMPVGHVRRRRYYDITDEGRRVLAAAAGEWRLFAAQLLAMLRDATSPVPRGSGSQGE